jgi:hypothetical protein
MLEALLVTDTANDGVEAFLAELIAAFLGVSPQKILCVRCEACSHSRILILVSSKRRSHTGQECFSDATSSPRAGI